tara:strand:+ start:582 stop:947 length:366 start_codon:yes stop_codon:yes gene_type:complete
MGKLTAHISLKSKGVSSSPLELRASDVLIVTNPSLELSRVVAPSSGQVNLLTVAENTAVTYLYMRNMDSTNFVVVKTDAAVELMVLAPNEFAFLPVQAATGIEVTADTAECVIEYGYWTKA